MKRAVVIDRERVAERFYLLTLESPQFRGAGWVPGQKIQVRMGTGLATRTYTPLDWDPDNGRLRILAFAHGPGPGSEWASRGGHGDACHVFGPRTSIDLRGRAPGPVVVLGDETSLGLIHALSGQAPGGVHGLVETDACRPVRQVLARLGLKSVEPFEKRHDDAHVADIECRLSGLAADGAQFVLTGRSWFIQRMRRTLKMLGMPAGRLTAKAYWVPGKTGLD
ncbi:siderophore-interacting protein [uncultured Massilia sp.]|uniref:siderophore-interacting protein n=1 Tax=uncultured Massilia sp. TaxID=169973 RepID=UPI0025F0FB58|nr:siderophore-interacting protein [uncultured Massilia sp.]